ncbi:MAG TPA: HupE/UreJ family protein [Opitutaceae bacterium]|jgi:hydrogenase/urease accessory protein HupE
MKLYPALLGCLVLTAGPLARAHDPGLGTNQASLRGGQIDLDIGYAPADIAALGSGKSLTELAAQVWAVSQDGHALTPQVLAAAAEATGRSVRFRVEYDFSGSGPLTLTDVAIARLPPGHRDYLIVSNPAGTTIAERLVDRHSARLEVAAPALAQAPAPAASFAFLAFLRLGIMHIWTGYDHLLFLFGLLVVTRNFRSVVGIISCFTLAHSITLALSTLNIVTVPSRIVEPLIAASIVFVGIENLLALRRGREPAHRWRLTFAFGLIHGFGFASALRELGVGVHGGNVALPLFTFNLGVEVGQIAIAAIALPVIWRLRSMPRLTVRWPSFSSAVVAGAGMVWLLQRTVFA